MRNIPQILIDAFVVLSFDTIIHWREKTPKLSNKTTIFHISMTHAFAILVYDWSQQPKKFKYRIPVLNMRINDLFLFWHCEYSSSVCLLLVSQIETAKKKQMCLLEKEKFKTTEL